MKNSSRYLVLVSIIAVLGVVFFVQSVPKAQAQTVCPPDYATDPYTPYGECVYQTPSYYNPYFQINTTQISSATVGTYYGAQIDFQYFTDGSNYATNATFSNLPPGITTGSSSGPNTTYGIVQNNPGAVNISGTPTTAGTYTVSLTLTDQYYASTTRYFSLNVYPATSTPLSITTASALPSATVGVDYYSTLTATGASLPYGWSGSNLPPGMIVSNQQTDANSSVGGLPTTAGTYTFTVTVTGGGQTASKQFTLTVNPATNFPDFSVGNMEISPKLTSASNAIEINKDAVAKFTIRNQGTASSAKPTFSVSYVGGLNPASTADPNIATNTCNALTTLAVNQTCDYAIKVIFNQLSTTSSYGSIRLDIDLANAISESDETNNWGVINFDVRPANSVPGLATVTPNSGPIGTSVTLYGNDLGLNGQSTFVKFGTTQAQYSFGSGPYIYNVIVPNLSPGVYPVTVQVGQYITNPINFTVTSQTNTTELNITTQSPLPNATVGVNYFTLLTASGASLPYGWSGSGLPSGLVVSNQQTDYNSNIGGIPTTSGNYTFTVTATSGSKTASKQFTLTVNPASSSGNVNLSLDATTPISQTFVAGTANVPIIYFKISNGSATQVGISTMDIRLDGTANPSDLGNVYWYYSNALLGQSPIASTTVGAATARHAYITLSSPFYIPAYSSKTIMVLADIPTNTTIGATLGFSAYAWGNNLNITGSPVTGNLMTISNSTSALTISSPSFTGSVLPNAKVGTNYNSATIIVTGGTAPFSWNLTGSLSAGLSLACSNGTSTGTNTCSSNTSMVDIVGTPTSPGTYNFTLTAFAGNLSTSKQFTLTVNPAATAYLQVTSPNGGEKFEIGKTYNISWNWLGVIGNVNLSVCEDKLGSGGCADIALDVPNSGAYTWDTSKPLLSRPYSINHIFAADDYTVYITSVVSSNIFDGSDGFFSFTPVSSGPNRKPLGWLDSTSNGYISGWAIDPNHLDALISVHIYFDQAGGGEQIPVVASTLVLREDVNRVMQASGTHGFKVAIPSQYADGKTHRVYIYAIDQDDTTGKSNVALYGSGKSFKLDPGSNTGGERHPWGSVVLDPAGTVYFLGTNLRYAFPSPEVFFSWGHSFSELVQANAADLAMPIGPMVEMRPPQL